MGGLFGKKKKAPSKPKTQILSILAIGNQIVGKTSLVQSYESIVTKQEKAKEQGILTVSADFVVVDITVKGEKNEDVPIKVKIWDSPGQERFKDIVLSSIKNTQGIFLVYDITVKQSFADLNNWIGRVKECKSISDFPFIIIANKIDLEEKRKRIDKDFIQIIDISHTIKYYETSTFTGKSINEVFSFLIILIRIITIFIK